MRPSVFLSHSHADKPFTERLGEHLDLHGVKVWIDEAEINIGDSLIEKLREGIDSVEYVAAILSPESVKSAWVQKELDVAMNLEIAGKRLKVLPLMHKQCELPGFLLGKVYADFTDPAKYEESLKKLLRSINVVFNPNVLKPDPAAPHLGRALDRAGDLGIGILAQPFHRPFQYIGMTVQEVARIVRAIPNKVGNIVVEGQGCEMLFEAEGAFVNYVEVSFVSLPACQQTEEFDSIPLLGALSINPAELELARKQTHCHAYYDHKRRLKIGVSCSFDEGPLTVGFSAKYYGM